MSVGKDRRDRMLMSFESVVGIVSNDRYARYWWAVRNSIWGLQYVCDSACKEMLLKAPMNDVVDLGIRAKD
jgi:hypothetical protein